MKLKLLFALLIVQVGFAQQRTCGMEQYMQNLMANPELKQQYLDFQQQFESELQRLTLVQQARNGQTINSPNVVIRIPVAVHFPTVTATASNVALRDCLLLLAQRQINILNADYNATNTDISLWSAASSFYPGVNIGNMTISFELATQNHPTGSGLGFPTNGNPAITFGTDFLTAGNINCQTCNEDATWAGYFNLVVTNIAGGVLGFSPLGGNLAIGKTVVIDNNAFGAAMTTTPTSCSGFIPNSPYNLGRTLTHELGHFFNLNHTFNGCDSGDCSNSGDMVCDTPACNQPWFSCNPPGSATNSTCGETQLTMNYMDYVNDSCMYMFTAGQATRMTAWYNTIVSLIKPNVLSNSDFVNTNFSIAPNPNKGTFNIQFKEAMENYSVEIYDATGRVIFEKEYIHNQELQQNISLNSTLTGVYFVSIKSEGVNAIKKVIVE